MRPSAESADAAWAGYLDALEAALSALDGQLLAAIMWNTYGWWLLATVAFFAGIAGGLGGSALDAGKAIALMVGQTRPIWDFEDREDWYTRVRTEGMAPVVAVPTPFSGSEATDIWGMTQDERKTTGTDARVLRQLADRREVLRQQGADAVDEIVRHPRPLDAGGLGADVPGRLSDGPTGPGRRGPC